jgi:hypothetical protein
MMLQRCSLSNTSTCSLMMGHGIMGYKSTDPGDELAATLRAARRVLISTGAMIVTKKLGHNSAGLGQVIWTEINPITSGQHGHHNYQSRVAPGYRMRMMVQNHDLGTMTLGPWGGQDHGSTSSLRVTAWSPCGPLNVLDRRMKAVFGKEYEDECRHFSARAADW